MPIERNPRMIRNIIVAAVSLVIVGGGITFQVLGTESHEVKDEAPASSVEGTEVEGTGEAPAPTDGDRAEGETNDEGGKPGEADK